jgi:hypothetical protein
MCIELFGNNKGTNLNNWIFLDKVDLWFTSFWVKENFGLPRLKRIYLVSKKREGFIWIWIFLGGHFGSTKLANDYIGF